MSILLADDDAQLATFLSKSLETEGYSVHTAPDENSVVTELKRQNYQLIILDLNFGQTDGLNLLERLRTQGLATPVMVLSARNKVTDRIRSFKLGADDYVTKPFSFQELAARASALLRRKADPALSILRFEDLELDPATHKVHRGSREIKLSPKEFDMLFLLMRRGGATVSRQELLRECWGQELESDSNLVDVYVNYLRKKVDTPTEAKLIYTVRGSGYRLGKPPAQELASHLPATIAEWSGDVSDPAVAVEGSGSGHAPEPQVSIRNMVHSVTHDLAQPLTSVRCFLETLTMARERALSDPEELKLAEQQADRAIALAKSIAALVRDVPVPSEPWVSLHALLNDIFDDFNVLLNSGLITLDRKWNAPLQVTSDPGLRYLMVLLISKFAGRNSRPLVLSINAAANEGRCLITFRWKANDSSSAPVADARAILARDGDLFRETAASFGGEFNLADNQPEVSLVVPAAPGNGSAIVH